MRQVGDELRAMGLKSERINRLGRGVKMTQEARTQIEALKNKFGVNEKDAATVPATRGGNRSAGA